MLWQQETREVLVSWGYHVPLTLCFWLSLSDHFFDIKISATGIGQPRDLSEFISSYVLFPTKIVASADMTNQEKHQQQIPLWIFAHVQSIYDPPGNGNCGYHCLAHALAKEPQYDAYQVQGWYKVHCDLLKEMENNKPVWTRKFGGSQAYHKVYKRIHVNKPKPGDDWVSKNH
jgi:hypothetical protein